MQSGEMYHSNYSHKESMSTLKQKKLFMHLYEKASSPYESSEVEG